MRNYWEHVGEHIGNLGNMLRTHWEEHKKSLILQKKKTHIEKIPILITLLPCVSLRALLCIKGVNMA